MSVFNFITLRVTSMDHIRWNYRNLCFWSYFPFKGELHSRFCLHFYYGILNYIKIQDKHKKNEVKNICRSRDIALFSCHFPLSMTSLISCILNGSKIHIIVTHVHELLLKIYMSLFISLLRYQQREITFSIAREI